LWALLDVLASAAIDIVGFSLGGAVALEMARARAPTLAIAAEHDYTPLAAKRAELRLFPQVELVVIAGSRHGTPFDAIERFNATVLDFLGAEAADGPGRVRHHQSSAAPV